jgi:CheY-like chemotaxis protein
MTDILLIDDSEFDRQLVLRLLSSEPNWNAEACQCGDEALQRLEKRDFDLVVTDLRMPGMDGLEVIQKIHERHPMVPVILITSYGNEDIAMQALQQGAASYVPKRSMAVRLPESVRAVLSVSRRERKFAEAVELIDSQRTTITVPNDRAVVSNVVAWMQEQATQYGVVESHDAVRLGVALEESLMNAIIHGNLEVSSELRQQGDGSLYDDFIKMQALQEPFCRRRVIVTAVLNSETATFEIRDEGPGFCLSALPDPLNPENLLRPSGRGLLLIQAFMDDVVFNDKGNCITMTRRRESVDSVKAVEQEDASFKSKATASV